MSPFLKETKNSNATVTDIRRLGAPKTKNDKPRPLRVTFSNEKERDDVLSAAYKMIKENKDSKENNEKIVVQVSLRKDLTKQERDEEDKLYQELRSRRQEAQESGDDRARWVRRRGKVVNIGNYQATRGGNREEERKVWGIAGESPSEEKLKDSNQE